jgi:hypothetical protein
MLKRLILRNLGRLDLYFGGSPCSGSSCLFLYVESKASDHINVQLVNQNRSFLDRPSKIRNLNTVIIQRPLSLRYFYEYLEFLGRDSGRDVALLAGPRRHADAKDSRASQVAPPHPPPDHG